MDILLFTNHYPYRVVFPDMLGGMPAVVGELLVFSKPGRICFLPGAAGLLPAGSITGMHLYTLVKLDVMRWNLQKGDFYAEFTFLGDQRVEIGFGEKLLSCRMDGETVDVTRGNLIVCGTAGRTCRLNAVLGLGGRNHESESI